MLNRLPELFPDRPDIRTHVVIEPSLANRAAELLTQVGFEDKAPLIVCDAHTHAALGKRLMNELSALHPQLLILQGDVRADEAALDQIRTQKAHALVAVGSGTINDLCKYASFLDSVPYVVFPTAPSMNGYLSANASITLAGVKETRKAQLPAGVFCDMKVIAAAPKRLIRSGLGDSLCRPTAQADWLFSHLALNTPYDALPFEALRPYEAELFAHSDKLAANDVAVVELLMRTLLVSGLGMVVAGGSYPASQGEHMIAHTIEMKHGDHFPITYHGEQIGVTTLTMARIQQELLSHPLRLHPLSNWEKALGDYLGAERAKLIAQGTRKKYQHYDAIAARLTERDAEIRDTLRKVTLPETYLRDVLLKAGAPTTVSELGWNERDYQNAVAHARLIRDRFTCLECLA